MRNQPEVREQMFKLIEQWQQSGLTQNAFCEQQSMKYHVFHYWYRRYRRVHDEPKDANATFVKLQIAKPVMSGSVEINYPGGIRLTFHEPVSSSYLKALIG